MLLCYVLGPPGSGKTTLLTAFARSGGHVAVNPDTLKRSAINMVQMPDGSNKWLVVRFCVKLSWLPQRVFGQTHFCFQLQEFDVEGADMEIVQTVDTMAPCDVACFLYDTSDFKSFEYSAALRVGSFPL